MQTLLQELRDARRNANAGVMDKAREHLDKALHILEAEVWIPGPRPKASVWSIRAYISEARFAITKSNSRRAISALDQALNALEPEHDR